MPNSCIHNDGKIRVFLAEKEEIKSCFQIGNMYVYLPQKYNWFNKKMYKLFFNIELFEVVGWDNE